MSAEKQKECWLKSVKETHPHIQIHQNVDNFVGRTRETQLADTLVSKQHLKFRVDFEKKCVKISLLGVNASVLNGKTIEKDKEYTAHAGDVIEIIPSNYPYKVHFENCDEPKPRRESESLLKRKRSVDIDAATNDSTCKRMKWQMNIFSDGKPPVHESNHWESYNNRQMYVYTTQNCRPSNKIAAYDMDGCLITTKSGKVFPTNKDDWKLAFGNVISSLKAKHNENYKIVIFTNQAGITNGKTKLPDIKTKIENIAKLLAVPLQAFMATGDSAFRKPMTGMWQALCDYNNDGIAIDIEQSFYVGDAAGRPENKAIKRKKDHSCVDRLLAINLGLPFFTPEEHFLKTKTEKWISPEFHPKQVLAETSNLTEPPNAKLTANNLEVIIMVGL